MTEYKNLPPSGIGEASKYNFSPWYIKIRFDRQDPVEGRNWNEANTPVSTLQTTVGNEYEEEVYNELEELVYETKNSWYDWDESERNEQKLVESVSKVSDRSAGRPTALEQARLEGTEGVFNLSGDADLILLYPSEEDKDVHIQVIDIKSSWEEKPSQQLQAATYSLLVRKILSKSDTDFDYTIDAGIFYRETDIGDLLTEEDTPRFDSRTREGDVKRVLREDGPFARAFDEEFHNLPLTIDENSPYAEVSVVEALESSDLSLLGISPGEKQKFFSEGIETVEDMARLYEKVEEPKPYEYKEPKVNDEYEKEVNNLKQNYRISDRLHLLSQKAQSVLGVINPESDYAHDKPWSPWIIGSGSGDLPEDNPPYDAELPMRDGGMIRIYMNVQYDHVRDTLVSVSGRITAGVYDSEPLTFSRVVDDFSRNPDTWQGERERELLRDAATDMFNAINLLSQISNLGSRIVPHIYLYSNTEYDALYESVERHKNEEDEIDILRHLLDRREGIDQKMVSIVENDISSRIALDTFDTSVHSMIDSMYPNEEVEFESEDWIMQTEGGEKVDLSEVFKFQMFDNFTPIRSSSRGVKVLNEYNNEEPNNFHRIAPRSGSQIPIEYLWACEDVGILDESWTEKSRQKGMISRFVWANASEKNRRITSSMYESMTRCLAKCLHHVERGISYRNTDIEKEKISIQEIAKECQEETDLSTACKEFLDFESKAAEDEALDVYSEPLERRIIEGKSIPVRITDISREEPYMFEVKGQAIYDEFDFQNPRRIASSSEISGGDGSSGGSRCVATPINKTEDGYNVAVDTPKQIAGSTKVTVDEFNPNTGEVKIRGYRQSNKSEYEYVRFREPWTLDPSEPRKQYVGPGETFVLDPNPDSKMADKSLKSIRHAEDNPVYQDIIRMKNSGFRIDNSIFDSSRAKEYIEWSEEAVKFSPNRKQRDFVEQTSTYSLLQGPPGTGKTSGALAHAVMARAYDMEKQDSRLTGLVTGLSNKSVDELLEDVAELKQIYDDEYDEHPLNNVRLVRLSYDSPENTPDCVEYRNYQIDEDKEILRGLFEDYTDGSQQQQLSSVNSSNEHTIIFSTPGRIESLAGKIEDNLSSEEVYSRSDDLFDFVAVDEASMMPIYQLLLVGHFCSSNSQVMLAGDHRQLPPVRQHDWDDENRKSIVNNLPHLSVLDYLRYLRGDDVDEVYDESPDSPELNIPIVRLERTYRCHKDVTEFLRKTVYSRDNINYTSMEDDLISEIESDVDVINTILDNDEPMTVVIHDDRNSQQVNIPESDIISEIIDEVPESESVGVVTPHNAQKGRLRTMCPRGLIDTVERFQGGEKDVMILSTTVSDPSHLSDEEDFILSLNRLNVALSRMKKKLIVVVPQSVFELVPDETDMYDESTVWKSMYSEIKADEKPDGSGQVSEIRQESTRGNVEFDLYHLK